MSPCPRRETAIEPPEPGLSAGQVPLRTVDELVVLAMEASRQSILGGSDCSQEARSPRGCARCPHFASAEQPALREGILNQPS